MIDFNAIILMGAEHEQDCYRLACVGRAWEVVCEGRALLHEVHKTMPSVVIVGGFVRDTYFMREVKDVDYMTANGKDVERMAEHLGRPLLNCLRDAPQSIVESYAKDRSLMAAYETESKDVNLLLVTKVMQRINEFPDSISQCWTDGEHMYGTPAFMATAMTRVVTMDHMISAERVARLKAKYPDFNFEYEI